MADTKISALTELTGANTATNDVFPIVDTSATTTKKITLAELGIALGTDTALQPSDVGTAAAQDVGYFATAAQGSTADTAIQPGDDAADLGSGAATDNYVLTADGSGGAAWEAASGGGIANVVEDTTPQLGGNLDLNSHSITGTAGTLTTDVKVLDLSATWDSSGTTFTGLKFNVTNTASASDSLLMDLQVGGSSSFSIGKDSKVKISGPSSGAAYIIGTAQYREGSILIGHNGKGGATFGDASGGTVYGRCDSNGIYAITDRSLGFSTTAGADQDLRLWRDAANILAQRNTTNAQTFRLYNTYTDASNYERLAIEWAANVVSIKPENAGTGSARVLHISGLPTSNPGAGILWNNAGTPAIGT